MFLWLSLVRFFSQCSAIAASVTITSRTRAIVTWTTAALVCAMASKLYWVLYLYGRYNRELSARWSFGVLYSRGCYLKGALLFSVYTIMYVHVIAVPIHSCRMCTVDVT